MQLELLFTMLSLGFTSAVSVQSTVLGFHLVGNPSIPMGSVFGLFLAGFGLYSSWHLLKSNVVNKDGRTQLTRFLGQLTPF